MERITTGIPELDEILDGGLPRNSLTLIAGAPGTGKTILAQQLVHANARPDAPALYLSTLSEPTSKMVRHLQRHAFFDEAKLLESPPAIIYRDIAQMIRGRGFAALGEILAGLLDEHQPATLVVDSFKALRDLATSGPELRRTLFDVAGTLTARACTTLLVGEYTGTEVAELAEFAIADAIVQLVNRAAGTRDERYLRLLKLRGSSYRGGEHAFRITEHGLAVFPRIVTPAQPSAYMASAERIATGVPGLDRMLGGGLRRGSSTLVVGAAGTGKTLLGLHFLFAGAAAGEHGLLISFQENPSLLRHLVAGLGFDVTQLEPGGRLTAQYLSPVEMNIDDVVQRAMAVVSTRPIQRVVIDSLGDLEAATTDSLRFRSYVYSLTQLFAVRNVTSYATNEALVEANYASFSRIGSSHISDNVLALRYTIESDAGRESGRSIGRSICVVKCRGTAHDHHIRRMTIGARGIDIREPVR